MPKDTWLWETSAGHEVWSRMVTQAPSATPAELAREFTTGVSVMALARRHGLSIATIEHALRIMLRRTSPA